MYSDIYKAWKAEKSSNIPQPLPPDFYQRAGEFVKGLEKELASTDTSTIQSRLLTREKDVSARLLAEIEQVRLQKILTGVQRHLPVPTSNLIGEEVTVNTNLNQTLPFLHTDGNPLPEDSSVTLASVRFLQDIPEIVGVDLKIYGPFKKEDVASLPSPNAQALEKQGAVKGIEIRNVA